MKVRVYDHTWCPNRKCSGFNRLAMKVSDGGDYYTCTTCGKRFKVRVVDLEEITFPYKKKGHR